MSHFGKVGVLMGGNSAEREVSLSSGTGVLQALRAKGVDAHPVDVGDDIVAVLQAGHFDRVFNMLHGRGGEDGTIQGLLEYLNIPYTKPGVLGSAVAMNKGMCKYVWQGAGLPTAPFVLLDLTQPLAPQVSGLKLPLAVKPVFEGSSIGTTKVTALDQLSAAVKAAQLFGDVMVEEWIEGSEYTVGIVGEVVLPSVEICVGEGFYDYHQKYEVNSVHYHCPSRLSPEAESAIQQLAKRANALLECAGWSRVDLMRDQSGAFYLLEINTTTGMTPTSLVPKAAKVIGWSYEDLVIKVLEQTL